MYNVFKVCSKCCFLMNSFLFCRCGGGGRLSSDLEWVEENIIDLHLQKLSAQCYETEHAYLTFQPQSILKVHVTMFQLHVMRVTLDLMSNSPLYVKGNGKQFSWRILQWMRCNSSMHPFNCKCSHHKLKTRNQSSFNEILFSVAVMSCGSDKKIYLGELQAWFGN